MIDRHIRLRNRKTDRMANVNANWLADKKAGLWFRCFTISLSPLSHYTDTIIVSSSQASGQGATAGRVNVSLTLASTLHYEILMWIRFGRAERKAGGGVMVKGAYLRAELQVYKVLLAKTQSGHAAAALSLQTIYSLPSSSISLSNASASTMGIAYSVGE